MRKNPSLYPHACNTAITSVSKFCDHQSGAIAIPMALMITVMVAFIGAAVDFARWQSTKSRAQVAIDNALLTAARSFQTNGGDKDAALRMAHVAYAFTMRQGPKLIGHTISFDFAADGQTVLATGSARISTPFLKFVNLPDLTVLSLSAANAPRASIGSPGSTTNDIEVSMMLDITGSMAGSRLDSLKQAAKDLVEILIPNATSARPARIALVPYAAAVNLGAKASSVRGTIKNGNCTVPGCQSYTFVNALGRVRTLDVTNCVSERSGQAAFGDSPPSSAKAGYAYLPSGNPCPTAELIPLSSDKTKLRTAIDGLHGGGSTGAQIGFGWAWYVLSPNWGSLWPNSTPGPYNDSKVKKIAVLMTDGEFNSPYCNGVISSDATYGSGSTSDHINCKAPNGSPYAQALKLCAGMKAAGIEVYTVGFDVIDALNARQVMKECASDPSRAYDAKTGEQLQQAFRDIGLKIAPVYLSK